MMGLRFQKRLNLFPGLRLNLSRSGVGLSVGARGAHIGVTARGQRYSSLGLPGTGISWREYEAKRPAEPRCDLCQPGHMHISAMQAVGGLLLGLAVVLTIFSK
jgi:hypothetical protein